MTRFPDLQKRLLYVNGDPIKEVMYHGPLSREKKQNNHNLHEHLPVVQMSGISEFIPSFLVSFDYSRQVPKGIGELCLSFCGIIPAFLPSDYLCRHGYLKKVEWMDIPQCECVVHNVRDNVPCAYYDAIRGWLDGGSVHLCITLDDLGDSIRGEHILPILSIRKFSVHHRSPYHRTLAKINWPWNERMEKYHNKRPEVTPWLYDSVKI